MDYNTKALLVVFLALSFFSFGWISHSAYTPASKPKKLSLFEKIKKIKN